MTKTVEFLFDVGSPTTYLAHKRMPGLIARTGAEVVYVPVLLGGLFKARATPRRSQCRPRASTWAPTWPGSPTSSA